MAHDAFDVVCPCCGGRLTLDAALREVIAHTPAPQKREIAGLGGAIASLKAKALASEAKLKEGLEGGARRGKLLDRKLEEGFKRAAESPDPPRRAFDYD